MYEVVFAPPAERYLKKLKNKIIGTLIKDSHSRIKQL